MTAEHSIFTKRLAQQEATFRKALQTIEAGEKPDEEVIRTAKVARSSGWYQKFDAQEDPEMAAVVAKILATAK